MHINTPKACLNIKKHALLLWLNSNYGMSPVEFQHGRLELSEQ